MKSFCLAIALVFSCASIAQSVPHKRFATPIQNIAGSYVEGTATADDLVKALLRDDSGQDRVRSVVFGQPTEQLRIKLRAVLLIMRYYPVSTATKVYKLKVFAAALETGVQRNQSKYGWAAVNSGIVIGAALGGVVAVFTQAPPPVDDLAALFSGISQTVDAAIKVMVGASTGVAISTISMLNFPSQKLDVKALTEEINLLCESMLDSY